MHNLPDTYTHWTMKTKVNFAEIVYELPGRPLYISLVQVVPIEHVFYTKLWCLINEIADSVFILYTIARLVVDHSSPLVLC